MPRRREKTDPHAAREAARYDRPIASREHLLTLLAARTAPLSFDEIASLAECVDDDMREALRRRLAAMERDGQLVRNRRGAWGVAARMDLLRGRGRCAR